MDEQNKNLLLATVLSFLVILVWFVLFPPPDPVPFTDPEATSISEQTDGAALTPPPATAGVTPEITEPASVANTPRIAIETPRLTGSLSLTGARIDELSLRDYKETLDPDSPIVDLLSPVGAEQPYYALHGWSPGSGLSYEDVPGPSTPWRAETDRPLSPETPLTLIWESPVGLIFRRTLSVDEDYMFEITQSVENPGETEVSLAPYGLIARHGTPETINFFILHEGVVRKSDGTLGEVNYDSMTELDAVAQEGGNVEVIQVEENGWIGFTDKYWMTTLIPGAGQAFTSVTKYVPQSDIYQTETRLPTIRVAPGAQAEMTTRLFAGAKEWEAIRHYQNDTEVVGFIDSIDWGWFYFLTKPIFQVLHWLNLVIGNMGIAIIGLTLLLKAVLLPLAFKSYVSMAKMKELQPEMEKIKERAGDDREKLQREIMELYKTRKVNPAAGCLPILLQIPIFFSLYKVIFVTIELRHAPFFGPFQDLSAPDPTSFINFFGLLPFEGPVPGSILAFIFIGILPLLLGISMWLQQKLNPAPTDPTQAMVFAWMPWIFMFMLGSFASGLLIYWIANNIITFAQQYMIMRSQGYVPDLWGNIKSGFKKTPDDKET